MAGVNKAVVYYHFGSKDDLFRACIEEGYADYADALQRTAVVQVSTSARDEMAALLGAIFDNRAASREHLVVVSDENLYNGMHLTPKLRKTMRKSAKYAMKKMTVVLEKGQASGEFRASVSAFDLYFAAISMSMFHLSNRHTASAALGRDLASPRNIKRWRQSMIDLLVWGISTQKCLPTDIERASNIAGKEGKEK